MRPCARTASVRQSTRLDLQPHEPRARHVGISPAFALAVRVPFYAEWRGVCFGAVPRRWLALLAASLEGDLGHLIAVTQTGDFPVWSLVG